MLRKAHARYARWALRAAVNPAASGRRSAATSGAQRPQERSDLGAPARRVGPHGRRSALTAVNSPPPGAGPAPEGAWSAAT